MEWKTNLKVFMSYEVHRELMLYAEEWDQELQGFGIVEIKKERLEIKEWILPKQETSGASVDSSPDDMHELMYNMIKKGEEAKLRKMRCWFHSHVNMGVFWSGKDEATMAAWEGKDIFINIVINKKGEYKCRIYIYKPFYMWIDGVDIEVGIMENDSIRDKVKKVIKDNVKKNIVIQGFTGNANYGSYSNYLHNFQNNIDKKETCQNCGLEFEKDVMKKAKGLLFCEKCIPEVKELFKLEDKDISDAVYKYTPSNEVSGIIRSSNPDSVLHDRCFKNHFVEGNPTCKLCSSEIECKFACLDKTKKPKKCFGTLTYIDECETCKDKEECTYQAHGIDMPKGSGNISDCYGDYYDETSPICKQCMVEVACSETFAEKLIENAQNHNRKHPEENDINGD